MDKAGLRSESLLSRPGAHQVRQGRPMHLQHQARLRIALAVPEEAPMAQRLVKLLVAQGEGRLTLQHLPPSAPERMRRTRLSCRCTCKGSWKAAAGHRRPPASAAAPRCAQRSGGSPGRLGRRPGGRTSPRSGRPASLQPSRLYFHRAAWDGLSGTSPTTPSCDRVRPLSSGGRRASGSHSSHPHRLVLRARDLKTSYPMERGNTSTSGG